MRRMWWLYVLGFLVLALGVGFLFAIRGLKETLGLKINHVDLSGVSDGTYQGEYEAGRFKLTVQVTVKNGSIAKVDIMDFDKSGDVGKKIWESVYGPTIDRIVESQSPNVDIMSGATATTKALLKAVENALVEAGGEISPSR